MLLVTIPLIWQYIGYYMVILQSAIASIGTDVLESAEIDGANGVQLSLIHISRNCSQRRPPKKTFPKHNGFSDNPAFFCSILRTYGHRRWMLR